MENGEKNVSIVIPSRMVPGLWDEMSEKMVKVILFIQKIDPGAKIIRAPRKAG
ncbi:hypothetical protein JCM10550A_16220 [Methanogenium cariaci]